MRALLGREPQGRYEIVVRDDHDDPVVLRNAPFMDDGTPMPTRYWLIGPDEIRRIGRLESDGGVDAAEAAIDPAELAAWLRLLLVPGIGREGARRPQRLGCSAQSPARLLRRAR